MPLGTYILGIVGALLTLGIVIEMLRRRSLRERHAVWWLIAGLLALVIGVFPQVLVWAAQLIGVEIPTNLVFFVSIFILFLVSIQHSSELTTLEQRSRTLAEESALQDLRIRELERRLGELQRDDGSREA
ncbi:DUF2304 domain-containing protein [Plantibacter sp. VKM Ac-2885]|nr:DUF2304 domain-containing protein [Plantibacter sp. CFBP 8775]MBD8516591.1 DUF2304 domain-containing protein [Plantibacter sp. CFBP 8804]MBD8533866.1 DUF2304 domain-containing protein [Plantibacter sp. CFBP 13570]MBF4514394.1 DUF2304 domain-containing protein [Plantibacter sp. VKM Ac-2885]